MSDFQDKEPGNVARGLEASLSNSNVPNDTKKRNFNRLNDMGEDYSGPYKDSTGAEQTKGYDGPASHTRQAEGEASAELTRSLTGDDTIAAYAPARRRLHLGLLVLRLIEGPSLTRAVGPFYEVYSGIFPCRGMGAEGAIGVTRRKGG
ncbi:hypothetical protein DFP72DRAFT_1047612, partial [Ephemerocybe angulata]